jgi:hypothetical protein
MSIEFSIHPNVYATGEPKGLVHMLERVWVREHKPGDGTLYIVSGFGNHNGAVRFLETFRKHVDAGGKVVSIFAGSTAQRLTSRQLVKAMLTVGAEVSIVNRKRLLHAKCYGSARASGESLVVTSGNFTGPGMGLNVESSVLLPGPVVREMGFTWAKVMDSLLVRQAWDVYRPTLSDTSAPAWKLLYDEYDVELSLDESEESTLLVLLGGADTARIQASPGSEAGKGTQYFWLSRDCYGFFPPLTIRNVRGYKATFSCIIRLRYVDLGGRVDDECRVTFEAENNLDFRLGTGLLRYTKLAKPGDIGALTRVGETEYELRIIRAGTRHHAELAPYLINFIGHKGKRYGFVDNAVFYETMGLPATSVAGIASRRRRPSRPS